MSEHSFSDVKKIRFVEETTPTVAHSYIFIHVTHEDGRESAIRLHRFGGPIEIERKKTDG